MTTASWYHCSLSPIRRSAGRSAVAAAAYRTGMEMEDRTTRETHDYTRRGGVLTVFTVAPPDAPAWANDPEQLANAMEARETRKNSQLAFECRLALPACLDASDREEIAREFTREISERYGIAAITALHAPDRHGDERNFHAHILFTTRRVEAEGLTEKVRAFNTRPGQSNPEITYLRKTAADLINDALDRAGFEERVDHRSYAERGIDRVPTEHLGPVASEIERDGRKSHKGDRNRDIGTRNEEITQTQQELEALVAEYMAIESSIVAEEERRLNERWGEPEQSLNPDERLNAFGDAIADTLYDNQIDLPETAAADSAQSDREQDAEKHGGGDASDRLEAFAQGFAEQIESDGRIQMRDGLSWWERTVAVFGRMRDNVTQWARDRWQGFTDYVDSIRNREDKSRDDPDLGR